MLPGVVHLVEHPGPDLLRRRGPDARKAGGGLHYFAGLAVEETAQVLGISAETVMRDWRMAKLRLQRDLQAGARPDVS